MLENWSNLFICSILSCQVFGFLLDFKLRHINLYTTCVVLFCFDAIQYASWNLLWVVFSRKGGILHMATEEKNEVRVGVECEAFDKPIERKRNRNALRSKRLIRQAFISLIKRKPADRITITDIVNEANINRATFYAHYSCLKDLIDEIEQEVIDKLMTLLKDFRLENFFSNPAPLLLQVSIFLSEDPEYYKTLVATPESGLFIEKLMSIFIEYMEQDQSIPLEVRRSKSFHIRALFFAGGLVSLYLQWFRGQLDCTLFDIPLEVSQLFTKDQSGIMLNMMGK